MIDGTVDYEQMTTVQLHPILHLLFFFPPSFLIFSLELSFSSTLENN